MFVIVVDGKFVGFKNSKIRYVDNPIMAKVFRTYDDAKEFAMYRVDYYVERKIGVLNVTVDIVD